MRPNIKIYFLNNFNFKLIGLAILLFVWQTSAQPMNFDFQAALSGNGISSRTNELPPEPLAKQTASDDQIDAPTAVGDVDQTFNGSVLQDIANVEEVLPLLDGKVLVGGTFNDYNGVIRYNLVRLNADGSRDTTFNLEANGTVLRIVRQEDGKILIGGNFTQIGSATRNRLARLNADGTLDTTFNFSVGANSSVYDIKPRSDGKILIGGGFTTINGTARSRLALLNSDGSLDASFDPGVGADNPIYRLAVQADGKIIIAGVFFNVHNTQRIGLARLNVDGSLDNAFAVDLSFSQVFSVIVTADDKILIGGNFFIINGTPRSALARLNANGSLDANFNPGIDGLNGPAASVEKIELQSDGKILVGGFFTVPTKNIARFNADGTTDSSFNPGNGADATVQALTILPDGKIFIGGYFKTFNSTSRNRLARLNADGSLDSSFVSAGGFVYIVGGSVYATAVQSDGKVLVGGTFDQVNGLPRFGIARLNANGSLDNTFNAGTGLFVAHGLTYYINTIAMQADGKILIGGFFNIYNGQTKNFLARLNADGSVDNSFNPEPSLVIQKIMVQPDGKILASGLFSFVNGQPYRFMVRLNPDGTNDSSFSNPMIAFGGVYDFAVQPDGKIIIGGSFTQVGGVARNRIARLNADGTLDMTFDVGSGASNTVYAVELEATGNVLIGGDFTTVGGVSCGRIARLLGNGSVIPFNAFASGANSTVREIYAQPNGRILIGGSFTNYNFQARLCFTRLNFDGTPDATWTAQTNAPVYNILPSGNDKIIVSGIFTVIKGIGRNSVARLFVEPINRRTPFDFDGDGKADIAVFRPDNGAWYLQQSANGFTGLQFGLATDKLVPGDYDGDNKTDVAVYRGGTWYLQRSQLGFTGITFGSGDDIPQPADLDGDGRSELVVFRPSNGVWYSYNLVTNQSTSFQFGSPTDKPVAADYDGDGKADYAVFRPSNGTWYLLRSSQGLTGIAFGDANDLPVPADYDGDGKSDVAVFRPSNGTWYLQRSQAGFTGVQFGFGTDLPVPADYDGDGKADVAVFRDGAWYLQRSAAGFTGVTFGTINDKPIPNAFVP